MTGDFHFKAVRQEVKWKPGLSTVSLSTRSTARPSHCQQGQLGQALRWPIVKSRLHVYMGQQFPSDDLKCELNRPEQRRSCLSFYTAADRNTSVMWKVNMNVWVDGKWWNRQSVCEIRIGKVTTFPNAGPQTDKLGPSLFPKWEDHSLGTLPP